MPDNSTLRDHVEDLMTTVAREIARAERFLQVLYRVIDDPRIPVDVRLEYVKRASAANGEPIPVDLSLERDETLDDWVAHVANQHEDTQR